MDEQRGMVGARKFVFSGGIMKTPSPQEAAKTVRELPILFAPDLAQKVYLGIKTETRRLLRKEDQLGPQAEWIRWEVSGCWKAQGLIGDIPVESRSKILYAPYQPGDVLYVRETWGTIKEYDHLAPRDIPVGASIGFPTDPVGKWCQTGCNGAAGKWRRSIHMPKWASRTWLEVLSVSVERIRDIREVDAQSEGYEAPNSGRFVDSWRKRYPGSWDRNDWVWVIKFKLRKSHGK